MSAKHADPAKNPPTWQLQAKKAAIWLLFLAAIYLARDFFFTGFMTFLFSYMTLAVVDRGMRRFSPDRERPWLRSLLTLAVFILVPAATVAVGALVAPRLVAQAQRLAGWASQVSPETEVARLLEEQIGPMEFDRKYHGPSDPRYQADLKAFRADRILHVQAYNDFPNLEAWVEGGFAKQYADAERGRIRSQVAREGTSSAAFEQWFLTERAPLLAKQAERLESGNEIAAAGPLAPLLKSAARKATPKELLAQAQGDPACLGALREEWVQDAIAQERKLSKGTKAYQEEFQRSYEQLAREAPASVPYTFSQFVELQKIRPQGPRAFGATLEKLKPSPQEKGEEQLRADFEAAQKHELFQQWWASSSVARFIREQVESAGHGSGAPHVERLLSSFLSVPVDLATALLLSFFICIDFPRLSRAMQRLRETWLQDVYDEIAPALSRLGHLIGMAMHAQGIIALCNATLIFLALTFLGVEHSMLLSVGVFVLCMVPTLGMMISWVLIAAVALVQPGGGLALALKASGAVLFVVLMETFVFSPRILGRMMELHPALIIALLPVAQYFFGVWGLILATPVAVYVIHVLILQKGLPGIDAAQEHEPQAGAQPPDLPKPKA